MLPGDYIAYRLSGRMSTSISGLSEQILWDFKEERRADFVADRYGIPHAMIPTPTFRSAFRRTPTPRRNASWASRPARPSPTARATSQQRLFAQRHGGGRDRRNGRHERRGLRRHGHPESRSAVARQYVRPRQPHARKTALRHPALHQRHGHHELVDTPQRRAANDGLRRDEPSGRKRSRRVPKDCWSFRSATAPSACSETAAQGRDRQHRPQPPHHGPHPPRRAGGHRPTRSATASTSCGGWDSRPTSSAPDRPICSSRRCSGRRWRRSPEPASSCSTPTERWERHAVRRWEPGLYKTREEAFASLRRLEVVEPVAADREALEAGYRAWVAEVERKIQNS